MKRPLASIILPTHNGENYIRRSIDSCLGQTYGNIELIIVDDGSTDQTAAIVESCTDARVRLIRHAVNKYLPAALNTGFAAAGGEYLTWTSDDNYYDARAVETMASFLDRHTSVSFVYADYQLIDEAGAPIRPVKLAPARELFYGNCIGACFLYRRKVYEAIGAYDTDAFLEEDYDYWFRVRREFKMKHIPQPLYYFRTHRKSLTATRADERKKMKLLVKQKYLAPWEWRCSLAFEAFEAGRYGTALRQGVISLLLNPFQRYAVKIIMLSLGAIMCDKQPAENHAAGN